MSTASEPTAPDPVATPTPAREAPSPARGVPALLLSVGGSPAPIVASIVQQRPRDLLFFVSPQSKRQVADAILPALPADYRHHQLAYVETPSAEQLDACYRALRERVPGILADFGLDPRDLRVDFTGGTKAMSAALVLALAGQGSEMTYVGGAEPGDRDKGGLGIVVDGRERIFRVADPWQEIAADRLHQAVALAAGGRYGLAAERLPAIPRARGHVETLIAAIRPIFEAFALWDRFQYVAAARTLAGALPNFQTFANGAARPCYEEYATACERCLAVVQEVERERIQLQGFVERRAQPASINGRAIPADLCAAARRRADQGDPEDGVMLLYAAVEKLARGRLIAAYGIDNSKCPPERLGPRLREKYPATGPVPVQLALRDSYLLLADLGDPDGDRFEQRWADVEKLAFARNHSWREHAYQQIKRPTFDSLLPVALGFLGLQESDLIPFPVPRW
jgi:CRISPR-associated protein (TIGR02710 family)